MLQRFNERLLFQVLFFSFNPFGTIYNPISLSQNIERAMTENMFSEVELLQNEEIFLSWFHSGKYFNQSKNLLLSTINQQQVKIGRTN